MSAEPTTNYPTFVNINTAHMSGVAAADNQGEISHDQGSIEGHQAEGINDHQQDSTIAISAFHDQQSPSINTDSDSHQNTVQDQLNNLSSPGEHEVEIYDVGDNSNADESTHVWVKEEVTALPRISRITFQLSASGPRFIDKR